jgi:hypothetical protein
VEEEIPESRRPGGPEPSTGAKIMNFIRVAALCYMIYSFVKGVIGIVKLRDQLRADEKYFS